MPLALKFVLIFAGSLLLAQPGQAGTETSGGGGTIERLSPNPKSESSPESRRKQARSDFEVLPVAGKAVTGALTATFWGINGALSPLGFLETRALRNSVKTMIENELKTMLAQKIRAWTPSMIRAFTGALAPNDKSRLRQLLGPGRSRFLLDISHSPYRTEFFDKLRINGSSRDAMTEGYEGAPVIFNLSTLSEYKKAMPAKNFQARLMALTFHEHVRHFGFNDNSHALGKAAVIAFDNEALTGLRYPDKDTISQEKLINLIFSILEPLTTPTQPLLLRCKTSLGLEPCPAASHSTVLETLTKIEHRRKSVVIRKKGGDFGVSSAFIEYLNLNFERRIKSMGYKAYPYSSNAFQEFANDLNPTRTWNEFVEAFPVLYYSQTK